MRQDVGRLQAPGDLTPELWSAATDYLLPDQALGKIRGQITDRAAGAQRER